MAYLNEDFLIEVFTLCFRKKEVIDICREHLQYHFLPIESYKSIWKTMRTHYVTNNTLPTIGIIAQNYNRGTDEDKDVLTILTKIKEIDIPQEIDIVIQLEEYIKNSIAVEAYDKFHEKYNQGEKDKAIKLWISTGEELSNFSIKKGTIALSPVFHGFSSRQAIRSLNKSTGQDLKKKVPFSIDELDERTGGGTDIGDIFLFLAQSGDGKSTLTRHIGVGAARKGFKVLHKQLEGTKVECEDAYDQTWTAQSLHNIEFGDIKEEVVKELLIKSEHIINEGGEIYIDAYEEFGQYTLIQLRLDIFDFIKIHGAPPDLVLIDYFELMEPGDKYYKVSQERQRREALSKGWKNIAVELKTRIGGGTQASTVEPEQLNNPDFVQTRYDISEFKGVLKPFSYFFTLNQTRDEYDEGIMRIYADKIRKYKAKWIATIIQAYRYGKFYDRKQTMLKIHNKQI